MPRQNVRQMPEKNVSLTSRKGQIISLYVFRHRLPNMIEHIQIESCTGCGVCDLVCPADVIHMEPVPAECSIPGLKSTRLLPVIKFREHCITCFSCEILCPEHIVDVHPSVKNRPGSW